MSRPKRGANGRFLPKASQAGASQGRVRKYGGVGGATVTTVDYSDAVERVAETAAEALVEEVTLRVTDEAFRLATLRTVTHGQTGEFLGRSKPGQPPAVETAALSKSIQETARTFQVDDEFVGIVGAATEYAFFLEVGTKRMKARPYIRPALDSEADRIDELAFQTFGTYLRTAGERQRSATRARRRALLGSD